MYLICNAVLNALIDLKLQPSIDFTDDEFEQCCASFASIQIDSGCFDSSVDGSQIFWQQPLHFRWRNNLFSVPTTADIRKTLQELVKWTCSSHSASGFAMCNGVLKCGKLFKQRNKLARKIPEKIRNVYGNIPKFRKYQSSLELQSLPMDPHNIGPVEAKNNFFYFENKTHSYRLHYRIVNSRSLRCPQNRSQGNQLIHRSLTRAKSIGSSSRSRESLHYTPRLLC